MKVVVMKPDALPDVQDIPNTLEALQELVGGYIEVVELADGLVVVCDEEGRLKGKPYCATLGDVQFVGTIALVGTAGCEFTDIPFSEGLLRLVREVFKSHVDC
jgi:hypothetical protein